MSQNEPANSSQRPQMPPPEEVAPTARRIMRLADKVAIATIDRQDRENQWGGGPFLSLTGVAGLMDATPVLLMSQISRHTQNLLADPRVSLLFDGTGDHANPLTEDRVTVNGRIVVSQREEAARRFMARHPKAFYAEFEDFSFYELEVEDAHFVGGFGTALTIPKDDLLLKADKLVDLLAAEGEICNHMNEQHSESVRNMAVTLAKGSDGPWQMTGLDPEGFDLVARKQKLRLDFPSLVKTADEAHTILVSLSKKARSA